MKLFVLLLLPFFTTPALAKIDYRAKIGIGAWESDKLGTTLTAVENMKFGWHYSWRTTRLYSPKPTAPRRVPFIPMVWDETQVDNPIPGNAGVMLGFNEPDKVAQANMTVDLALELWPKLMSRGQRLGSPAMAGDATKDTSWLAQFMKRSSALGYRVDFIAVHYYSANADVNAFKNHLTALHNKYQKPIWVTEWALVDWNNLGRFTPEQMATFAKASLEMLDDLPFVERHAWFAFGPHATNTQLMDANNRLTKVGVVFKNALGSSW